MISIITPTCRGKEGLKLIEKSLNRQTFTDFEWIIQEKEGKTPEGLYWTLYRDYNKAIKRAKGELIVSWQDYTYADPTVLEKFWFHHEQEPKSLVTGVGNKYTDDTWTIETWKDPRMRSDSGTFYPCYHNDIEWNLCSCPKEAIYAVGGFDEELDKYSSLCGLDVLDRIHMLGGYDFKIDQTIKSYSLEHGRLAKWEENLPFNGPYENRKRTYFDNPKLNFI